MATAAISKDRIQQLLESVRARKQAEQQTLATEKKQQHIPVKEETLSSIGTLNQLSVEMGVNAGIQYNSKQQEFISLASKGESCILIGAAGTGKTTCMKGTVQALIQSGAVGVYQNDGHKYLRTGTPGILILSYTRRAVNNIKKVLPDDLKQNAISIHKALEYQPEYVETTDPVTGENKKKLQFSPKRHMFFPLSSSIKTVIVEEASMVDTALFAKLLEALPHNPQFIFLGDIQQLPPVFGGAILGYKMLELPTIELTEVYRQALESPIIKLAHRILSGVPIQKDNFDIWNDTSNKKLVLHPWKKKLHADIALLTAAKFFTAAIDAEQYDIEEDMILIPYNKSFGTDELNKHIAQHVSKKFGRKVYEVIAGYRKHYFSVGDKVLYDKEDAVITHIETNSAYFGTKPRKESTTLDYWGCEQDMQKREAANSLLSDDSIDEFDAILAHANMLDTSSEEKYRAASHAITLKLVDSEQEVTITQTGEVNNLILSYAMTIHKSQGSEWRKVFLVLHQSHATMIQRELLYTAVTRAKEELYVICEPDSFVNGIKSQRIKGNTLAEKAEYFRGKAEADGMLTGIGDK